MQALILDDSQSMRIVLRRIGEKLGFVVFEAGDGFEGLRRLLEIGTTELIVVDCNMPMMNGLEFVKAVRTIPMYQDTFILMVSCESGTESIVNALQSRVDDFLPKPCTGKDIREKLQSIMECIAMKAHHPLS